MRKEHLYKVVGILLIVGSFLILLYPLYANHLSQERYKEEIKTYEAGYKKASKSQIDKELNKFRQYNTQLLGNSDHFQSYHDAFKDDRILGSLDIPILGIKDMPFYSGTSFATLSKGLGHLENTSLPLGEVGSHAYITGHSGLADQVLFTDLSQLKIGDIFRTNVLGKKVQFKVIKREIILPTQTDKLTLSKNDNHVTLITCYPTGLNSKRLLVTGIVSPITKDPEQRFIWTYQHIVICIILGVLLLISTIYAIRKIRDKRNEVKQ